MFEVVTPDRVSEYDAFVAGHPKGHFMQSSMWARQKPEWKWAAVVSRGRSGEIIGGLAVLIRKVPGMPWSLMYGCRGPVCDPHDAETIKDLIDGAGHLAKANGCYALKLDPDIESNHRVFRDIMTGLGFSVSADSKNFEGIQPRFVFRLDIEGKDERSLLEHFSSKTRYNIRLAERKGVVCVRAGHEAMPDFARLMKETGLRDGFLTRPQSYFDNMLDNLGEHCRLYMSYFEGIAVAGTLAVWYGDKVWYLYGASANEYRNLMPNYLCQWNMMQWALELGCRIYDFRGVSGDISEDNPLYGLYRFKKGFNGDFTEFIGELDLVYNKLVHFTVNRGERAFRRARNAVYLMRNRGKTDGKQQPNGDN